MRNNFSALARGAEGRTATTPRQEEAKRQVEEESKVPTIESGESSFMDDLNQLVIDSTIPPITTSDPQLVKDNKEWGWFSSTIIILVCIWALQMMYRRTYRTKGKRNNTDDFY